VIKYRVFSVCVFRIFLPLHQGAVLTAFKLKSCINPLAGLIDLFVIFWIFRLSGFRNLNLFHFCDKSCHVFVHVLKESGLNNNSYIIQHELEESGLNDNAVFMP